MTNPSPAVKACAEKIVDLLIEHPLSTGPRSLRAMNDSMRKKQIDDVVIAIEQDLRVTEMDSALTDAACALGYAHTSIAPQIIKDELLAGDWPAGIRDVNRDTIQS